MSTIDFCNGYLAALERLNSQVTDVYAAYELETLPVASDLETALSLRFADFPRTQRQLDKDFPSEYWNIQVAPLGSELDEPLRAVLRKWFFHSEHMGDTPPGPRGHHRENVVVNFLDELVTALGPFKAFHVITRPPI